MSNRNFDASWVTRRNRDKNVAQQIYGAMQNGLPVGNPMTINAQVGIITQFNPGIETSTEKNLRPGYSFNLGGIANYVDSGPIGPTATIPDAPVITGAVEGNLSATLTFTISSDGGSPITLYEYYGTNGLNWIPFTPTGNTFTISGLSVGFSYIIKIRVTNSVGTSNNSNTVTINGRTTPGAPTDLTVIPGNGQALLYFTAGSSGNSTITNYQYSTNGGSNWLSGGLTSPITISGLVPDGTIYNIILRAVNAIGNGVSSSSVSVASLSTFTPNLISNMNLWLDAQQPISVILTGGKVSAWNDSYSSGNNFTASASGTINYSFPSGINNRPALNFTTSAPEPPGISTYLSKTFNIAPTNQLTVFLVVRQTNTGSSGNSELFFTQNDYKYMDIFNRTMGDGILCINIGNDTQQSSGIDIITSPPTNAIISCIIDTNADMFVNGSTTSVSGTARGILSLNNSLNWAISAGAFLGNIGEVITYSTPLSTTQRQQVEGYLAWKWGTQDSLPVGHPYKNAPPTVTSFTTIGVTTWTAPSNITSVQYLVVGGGGGGGGGYDTGGGGGGGGGMVLTGTLTVTPGSVYTIEVGAGGSASTNNYPSSPETAGGAGGNSTFASITAYGGDGGKGSRTQTGGSGTGGAVQNSNITSARGGSGGGSGGTSVGGSGGGGGGATGSGTNGVSGSGGSGGTGLISSISGSSITYGIGGSGARGNFATTGASGTANRGNGGSGGGYSSGGARNGGAGGSGIVILKY